MRPFPLMTIYLLLSPPVNAVLEPHVSILHLKYICSCRKLTLFSQCWKITQNVSLEYFKNLLKLTNLGIFNEFYPSNNLARFVRHVECDFFLWFSNTVFLFLQVVSREKRDYKKEKCPQPSTVSPFQFMAFAAITISTVMNIQNVVNANNNNNNNKWISLNYEVLKS